MSSVTFYTLDKDGNDVVIGRIVFKRGALHADPVNSVVLRRVLKDIVFVPDKEFGLREIFAADDPELFFRSLHRHYKSAYFRAGPVVP